MSKTKKKNTIISLCLIAAILVSGAYAFLTATETKVNTFTIGNVAIDLVEPGWEDDDDDGNYNRTDGTNELIVPGDEVDKAPHVENVGENPAWIYMTVSIPAYDVNDFDDFYLTDNEQDIKVSAYGIQENYYEKDNLKDVWIAYTNDNGVSTEAVYTSMFGPEASLLDMTDIDHPETITIGQIFDLINVSNDWNILDSYISDVNGKYFVNLVYGYGTEPVPAADVSDPDINVTSALFEKVRLNQTIGEPAEYAVQFMEDDVVVAYVPFVSTANYITTPEFVGNYNYWYADSGVMLSPNSSVQVASLIVPNLTGGTLLSEVNSNPIVRAYRDVGTGSDVPKLVPLNSSSPAIIERGGVVETYVPGTPRGVTSVTTPTATRYSTANGFDEYFVYNLGSATTRDDVDAIQTQLKTELAVNGDGYFVYVPGNFATACLGTGAKIEVYNNDDELVERFTIVVFGDLNGDEFVTGTDTAVIEAVFDAQETGENYYNTKLYLKVSDFNNTDNIDQADITVIKRKNMFSAIEINQATGYAEDNGNIDPATLYQYVVYANGGTWDNELPDVIDDRHYGYISASTSAITSSISSNATRSGYAFAGLTTTPNGSVMSDANILSYLRNDEGNNVRSHNLYVVWAKLYTVTYSVVTHNVDGTTSTNEYAVDEYLSGETITARAVPSETGYEYEASWTAIPATMSASNVSVTINRWPINKVTYKISYLSIGSNEDDLISIKWANGSNAAKKNDKILDTSMGNIPLPADVIDVSTVPSGKKLIGWHIVDMTNDLMYVTGDYPYYAVNVYSLTASDVDIAAIYSGNTIDGWQTVSIPYRPSMIYDTTYNSEGTEMLDAAVVLVPVFANSN